MLELAGIVLERGGRPVLDGVDLRIAPGERVGLVGPSGCGKSSLLKLVAGLLAGSAGRLDNGFGRTCLVFQEPRLLPWRSVLDNLRIPLRAAGHSTCSAEAVARDWLGRVGLAARADAWPGQLSGGMAQRVSLARAFALAPDLLLLDEPFSALDPGLRKELGALCDAELRRTGAALLCVSHHPQELAERVDRCLQLDRGQLRPCVLPGHRAAQAVVEIPHTPAAPPAQASPP
ncbi:MAG: ABC transporter ATP-binding protein [Luteimonas sp.]